MDLKDAVLQRVDPVEFIGQYTALAHSGREWRGRCPFHQEKTASFYVSPEKGVYHCFGCKASGNVISFAMAVENLEFRDALEWLARRYNIPIPEYSPGATQQRGEKQRLYELNDAAAAFFREQLRGPKGELARAYLSKRGVTAAAAAEFDLGYAPKEWTALTDHLLSKGAKAVDLVKLSLIRSRDGSSGGAGVPPVTGQRPAPPDMEARPTRSTGHYDYFRHRLVFSIRDVTGRIIGFAGRALSDEDQPKYLNVAATPLYDKSRTLYNLDRAKGRLRDEGAVLVEGYMDVIGLANAGVQNAVACCGTALTEQHVSALERYTDRIYLAFDGDEAGRRAAWNAGALLLGHGINPGVALLEGEDPDEFIRRHGVEGWTALLQRSAHVVRVWLDHQLGAHPDATSKQVNAWVGELAGMYRGLPDELIRQDFFKAVVDGLKLDAGTVQTLLAGGVQGGAGLRAGQNSPAGTETRPTTPRAMKAAIRTETYTRALAEGVQPIEREVVRRLLTSEEFRFYYSALGQPDWFAAPRLRELYLQLAAGYSFEDLAEDPQLAPLVSAILLSEPLADSNEQLFIRHNNMHLEREIRRLEAEYRTASSAGDLKREDELYMQVLELKRQIRPVAGLKDTGYSSVDGEV